MNAPTDLPRPDAPGERGAGGADDGFFGPDSVTWRVHADPLAGLATVRGQLLHALHPVVMDALEAHSDFPMDPWKRAGRITEFLAVATFGTTTQAMLAGARVQAVHARLDGLTREGVPYRADDPQLLAWTHACIVASFLEIATRGGLRLTGAEQDRYVAEQVRTAMLVGLEPEEVPQDRAGLVDYFQVIRPLLECSELARDAARWVVAAPSRVHGGTALPPWTRAVDWSPQGWPPAGLAFATLPPWARRLYALPALPDAAGLAPDDATAALAALRTRLGRTPGVDA